MILDNYWKYELHRMQQKLNAWTKISRCFDGNYVKHQINKNVLLSAIIIRKIIEDENEAVTLINQHQLVKLDGSPADKAEEKLAVYPLDCFRMETIDDEDDLFLVNALFSLDNYKKELILDRQKLIYICNQVIHSYVWELIHKKDKIYGFVVSSDRTSKKECYIIPLAEWSKAIEFVVKEACI